jgi:hypothetical protein
MVEVACNSFWEDPGAIAIDAVDGNLTDSIQSLGVSAVDTSIPTAPGKDFSYVVEYYVEDKSKNAAASTRRLIKVVCPGSERYCLDPETGKPTCTSLGVCGASPLLSFGSSSPAASTPKKLRAAVAAAAPSISLLVPGSVQITAGDVYDRCGASAPMSEICERGATATDDQDGNLDRQVLVCGNR